MSARWEEANRGDSRYIGKVTLVPNRSYLFSTEHYEFMIYHISYL